MPPQQPQNPQVPPAPTPTSPSPEYDFIYSNQQPKRRFGFGLPGGNNLAKLTVLIVGAGAVLGILIIILSSVLGPKGVNTKQVADIMSRAQEISRVSTLVNQQPGLDPDIQNLTATTINSMDSEEAQLKAYLASAHKKVSTKDLNLHLDKAIDTQIQSAVQTNSLDTVYTAYLKKHLTDYQNALKTTYDGTKSATLKSILQDAFDSTQVILSAPQVAAASS